MKTIMTLVEEADMQARHECPTSVTSLPASLPHNTLSPPPLLLSSSSLFLGSRLTLHVYVTVNIDNQLV